MKSFRTLAIVAASMTFGIVGCAQTPADHAAHHPDAKQTAGTPMTMGNSGAPMARMDEQMKAMQAMHDRMMQAKTPEQRAALMAEHMKVMQESMTMMGGMGPGGMMGKGGMGAMEGMKDKPAMGADKGGMAGMQGKGSMDGDMGMHHQMMEKRMQMMQSMMQMMMDRLPPAAAKP